MHYRNLGHTGLKVSEIALGCSQFGGNVEEKLGIEILNKAFDNGIILFDTANVYQNTKSEIILGKAIQSWPRDQVVILTKVGGKIGEGTNDRGLSRKHIVSSVDASLRRLQTDYIDIYLAHWPDRNTPIQETLSALDQLVKSGKVRYIGCSNFTGTELCKALWVSSQENLSRFDCVESRYSVLTRWIDHDLLPLCVGERVGILAYNVLAGGFLTGKYEKGSVIPADSRFGRHDSGKTYQKRYCHERNFEAIEKLSRVAQNHGHSLLQLSLRWPLYNHAISSAVLGVNRVNQLMEILSAADTSISDEEIRTCDQVWEAMLPAGWFYQMGIEEYS